MRGEATLDVSGTFAGEAIRLPIQIAALHSTLPACLTLTFWPGTRWAASSSGSMPAPTPTRLSGSSSLTPIPRGSRRW